MRAAYYEQNGPAARPYAGRGRDAAAGSGRSPGEAFDLGRQPFRRQGALRRHPEDHFSAGDPALRRRGRDRHGRRRCAASRLGERVWVWNGQWARPFGTAAEYVTLPGRAGRAAARESELRGWSLFRHPGDDRLSRHRGRRRGAGQDASDPRRRGRRRPYAVQFAKLAGATVISTVSSPKRQSSRARPAPITPSTISASRSASASWRSPANGASMP